MIIYVLVGFLALAAVTVAVVVIARRKSSTTPPSEEEKEEKKEEEERAGDHTCNNTCPEHHVCQKGQCVCVPKPCNGRCGVVECGQVCTCDLYGGTICDQQAGVCRRPTETEIAANSTCDCRIETDLPSNTTKYTFGCKKVNPNIWGGQCHCGPYMTTCPVETKTITIQGVDGYCEDRPQTNNVKLDHCLGPYNCKTLSWDHEIKELRRVMDPNLRFVGSDCRWQRASVPCYTGCNVTD